MESPVRKMLKKNDYARHKLLRKIKRQRKARVELESHAAEKELKKKLKMPKFGDGKPVLLRFSETGNPLRINDAGNLEDQITGLEVGNVLLDEPIITPNHLQYKTVDKITEDDLGDFLLTLLGLKVNYHYGPESMLNMHGLETVSPEFDILMLGRALRLPSLTKLQNVYDVNSVISPTGRRYELAKGGLKDLDYLYDKDASEILLYLKENPEFAKQQLAAKASVTPNLGDDVDLSNSIKKILEFYKNDVYPRIASSDTDSEIISHVTKRDRMFNNTPGLSNSNVYVYDIPNEGLLGFANGSDTYVLYSDWFTNKPMNETLAHEFRHNLGNWIRKAYTGGRGLFGYTRKEESVLDDAYKFTNKYLELNFITPIKEKAATNTELRYRLHTIFSKQVGHPVYGRELDNMIYNMKTEDLLDNLNHINGYGCNFIDALNSKLSEYSEMPNIQDDIKSKAAENIKYALKYVGGYGAPATVAGTTLLKQPKYK